MERCLGHHHLPDLSVERPGHWGACSGARDLAKRQLGAMPESFIVKEFKSLVFL